MAKNSGRKLKVFQAQLGFHDSVVAAPSQAAALRAWGVRQNLFAEGRARITEEPEAAEAARAHPEIPLRRAIGSKHPFELAPSTLRSIPNAPGQKAAKTGLAPKAAAKTPPADRTKLDAAEAVVKALDERRKREEARLRARQADLEREMAAREATYVAKREAAMAAAASARHAYRKAGGED
ncbi:MAG TPA: hypothetical protein VKQ70_10000 [Caulobacteraceae bacterium]|nr:hypothetical protein [Caulobacteraceae bacterium]